MAQPRASGRAKAGDLALRADKRVAFPGWNRPRGGCNSGPPVRGLMLVTPGRELAFLLGRFIRLSSPWLCHATDEERRIAGREGILESFINEMLARGLVSSALGLAARFSGRHRTAPSGFNSTSI